LEASLGESGLALNSNAWAIKTKNERVVPSSDQNKELRMNQPLLARRELLSRELLEVDVERTGKTMKELVRQEE
jgi:hypothetical protein